MDIFVINLHYFKLENILLIRVFSVKHMDEFGYQTIRKNRSNFFKKFNNCFAKKKETYSRHFLLWMKKFIDTNSSTT